MSPTNGEYILLKDQIFEKNINDRYQLRYLNRITSSLSMFDEGTNCNINGPDMILDNERELPQEIRVGTQPKGYTCKSHTFHVRDRSKHTGLADVPETPISLKRGNYKKRYSCTSSVNSKSIKIPASKASPFRVGKRRCYVFPFLEEVNGHRRFALVPENRAKSIMSIGPIYKGVYVRLLMESAIEIVLLRVEDVPDDGLNIEIVEKTDGEISVTRDDIPNESYEREGVLVGHWSFSDSFSVNDLEMLKKLLDHVYGDYGFKRSSTDCKGLNTYTGKKSADFVRPSPRMEKEAANLSEYFRKHFDPTYLPLIYKLVNELSKTAGNFQNVADKVFDRFQLECWRMLEEFLDQYRPSKKRKLRTTGSDNRRFAGLSILTAGNSKISGFTNMPHWDEPDLWSSAFCKMANTFLDKLISNVTNPDVFCSTSYVKAVSHLKRLSQASYTRTFSSYTTCGYSLSLKNQKNLKKKVHFCYFIYLSLGIAVRIPSNRTAYHMFGGALCEHCTGVPVTYDGKYVKFNDDDLYVLAWGNGQSMTRRYMEREGWVVQGRITQTQIQDFFDQATNEQRQQIIAFGSLRSLSQGDRQRTAATGTGGGGGTGTGGGAMSGGQASNTTQANSEVSSVTHTTENERIDPGSEAKQREEQDSEEDEGLVQQNQNPEGDEEDDAIVRGEDDEQQSEERSATGADNREKSDGEDTDTLRAGVGDDSESPIQDQSRARRETPQTPPRNEDNNNDSEEDKINDPDYDYDPDSPGSPVHPQYDPSTESFRDWKKKMFLYAKLSKEHQDRMTQRYRGLVLRLRGEVGQLPKYLILRTEKRKRIHVNIKENHRQNAIFLH